MALSFSSSCRTSFLCFFVHVGQKEAFCSVLCLDLFIYFGFRMLLKPFSLEAHSRMLFSMLQKVLKWNPSRHPSTKVWILKVSALSFILKPVEQAGSERSIYRYLIFRDKNIAEKELT